MTFLCFLALTGFAVLQSLLLSAAAAAASRHKGPRGRRRRRHHRPLVAVFRTGVGLAIFASDSAAKAASSVLLAATAFAKV